MTLIQQYEAVFGAQDPSRRKLDDLPYRITIKTRPDASGNCLYCQRELCNGCPLPFDESTLTVFLNTAGVSTQAYFYYEDHLQKLLV